MGSCLVTGAAGFIGYHLCEALLAQGHYVLGVDNLNDYYDMQLKRDRLQRLRRHVQFIFSRIDLSDRLAVQQLFSDGRFDTVYHMAAQAGVRHSLENPYAYVDSNLVAFVNILENMRHKRPDHFIYASSSSVYGANKKVPFAVDDPVEQPMSLYAATKRSNELFAYAYSHLYNMRITGLRFFTVYGPWGRPDMAVYKFTKSMLAGEPIDVFNHGEMRRDFTYIDDVVTGILKAAKRGGNTNTNNNGNGTATGANCRLYNIGSNRPIDLSELISTLEECLGVKAKVSYHAMQPGEVPETNADIDSSRRDLNFKPSTTLRRGVEKFVEWYRDYHNVGASAAPRAALVDSSDAN